MKNIHILSTDNPSRLYKFADKLYLDTTQKGYYRKYNIYITNNEEIKERQNYIEDGFLGKNKFKWHKSQVEKYPNIKKDIIILTTDQDLIKDGVQAIDDDFLEWFVKNPSCEEVGVYRPIEKGIPLLGYKLIIPKDELSKEEIDRVFVDMVCNAKEEPKQETLEQYIEKSYPRDGSVYDFTVTSKIRNGIRKGAKWQQERSYSEEEALELLQNFNKHTLQLQSLKLGNSFRVDEWFEQFKKK